MRFYAHFKTYQKVISMFLVLLFVITPLYFLTLPKKAEATCVPFVVPAIPDPFSVPTHDAATSVTKQSNQTLNGTEWFKTCILDGLATLIAKTIIKALTRSIVQWINSGFKGNPSFVQNTGAFFGGIADKVAGQTIERAVPFLCSPFRLNVTLALAMQATGGGDSLNCTLTDVENNFNNFLNNSSINVTASANFNTNTADYWDNWYNITQNPQNNPYGAMMIASAKVTTGVQQAQGKYQQQLDWGKGFLSFESCPTAQPTAANNATFNNVTTGGGTLPPVIGAPNTGGNRGDVLDNIIRPGATNIVSPSNSSLASIGSLGLLDSLFADTSSNELTAVLYNANGTLVPMNAPAGTYYTSVVNGRGVGPVNMSAAGGGRGGYSLTSGMSLGSSNDRHVNAANPNDRQIYDANDAPIYGTYAGDNGCVTQTPGAVVESQLENFLGSDLRGLEIAQSIDQIVAALVGQLVGQVMGAVGGLAGASGGSSSGGSSGFDYSGLIDRAGGGAANITVPDLPITGACTPDKQNAQIGETVTWTAYIPDINGNVTYQWLDGETNLSGSRSTATTSYAEPGSKTAQVTVTSGGASAGTSPQTATFNCTSVQVGGTVTSSAIPTISCTASPSAVSLSTPTAVTWQAIVTGGIPPFIYSWQGDESLGGIGSSIIKTYTTSSTTPKTATVYVTDSDGYTYLHTCANGVLVTP